MYAKALRVFLLSLTILLLIFCSSVTLAGCSRRLAKSPPKEQQTEKKESENLKKLQNDIESLLKDFEEEYLKQTAPVPKAPEQQHDAQGQGEQQGQQDSEQQSGKGEDQQKEQGKDQQQSKQGQESQGQGQQKGEQAQQQGPDWSQFEMAVTKLHDQWNEFQGEAIKNGATPEMLDSFNSKLNELTINLTEQDLYGGLLAANDLYAETIPFEHLFKTKAPPDIKRVLYYARDAAYRALHDEQEKAMNSIASAMKAWESVKPQLDDTDEANKAEFALKDLQEAIPQKDPNLIKIETQILEKDFQDIIKSMEEKK